MDLVKCILSIFLHIFILLNCIISLAKITVIAQAPTDPEFLAPLDNFTVPQGREVSFTCIVNNLGGYKVAWLKSDSKAILGIHTHMISLNPRLSVTHNGHNTWKFHIANVHLNDSGSYMCQVNTDPMIWQSGNLNVVVPPDILNQPEISSSMVNANMEEGISNEGGVIQLICAATGIPEPTVQWNREDGKDIILRSESTREKQVVKVVEGERLILTNVQRTDMGGYRCVASNGVPPAVSKRFDVNVHFKPEIKVNSEIVGAPVDSQVVLECIVQVYPKPLNGWYKNAEKLHDGIKYNISEALINLYTWQLNLTIRNLKKADFGAYTCSSVNALGKDEKRINLQEYQLPPKPTTTPTPYVVRTSAKPRRKSSHTHNKNLNEVVRAKDTSMSTNHIQDGDPNLANTIAGNPNGLGEVHTQLPAKNGYEKNRNSQMPPVVPTPKNIWFYPTNGASSQIQHLSARTTVSVTTTTTINFLLSLLLFLFKFYISNELFLT
ncbi:hypothetical protein ACFFRR_002552 [Megaselia abdita]